MSLTNYLNSTTKKKQNLEVESGWNNLGNNIINSTAGTLMDSCAITKDGKTIIVGSYEDNNRAGKAEIYSYDGTAWTQVGNTISAPITGEDFGTKVAIDDSGTIVAITALFGTSSFGADAGYVEVYELNSNSWVRKGNKLELPFGGSSSMRSVSLSSDGLTVAYGGYFSATGGSNQGGVVVKKWNGTAWANYGSTILGQANNSYRGSAVSLTPNGNTIAIADITTKASIYDYDTNTSDWVERGSYTGTGTQGNSISISDDGNTLAYGEYLKMCVLNWNGSALVEEATFTNNNNGFGLSIDMNSNASYIIVGAYGGSGKAFIYEKKNSNWSEIKSFTGNSNDLMGSGVTISNNNRVGIVSKGGDVNHANNPNTNEGYCEVYQLDHLLQVEDIGNFALTVA